MITTCDDMYSQCKESASKFLGETESIGGILSVQHNKIGSLTLDQLRKPHKKGSAPGLSNDISEQQSRNSSFFRHTILYQRAYSTTRISRMIVTLILPGYLSSASILLAIPLAISFAPSSVTLSLFTRILSSRPA